MVRALAVLMTMLLLPSLAASPASASSLPSKKQWHADVRQAMAGSIPYVESRAARGGGRLAIVLDIDNTSLSTEYAWPKPVRPTLRFARRAHELGMGVFFVTGRHRGTLSDPRRQLKRAGYTVNGMCGRERGEGLRHSKQRCRRALTRKGWTIVANVGNRSSDFAGRFYERRFKLPSYGGRLS